MVNKYCYQRRSRSLYGKWLFTAILTAILSGKEIDPIQVMLDAIDIDRYDSVVA